MRSKSLRFGSDDFYLPPLLSAFAQAFLPEDPPKDPSLVSKGCVNACLKGDGGKVGPDLGRIDWGYSTRISLKTDEPYPSMLVGWRGKSSQASLTGTNYRNCRYLYLIKFFDEPETPPVKILFTEKGVISVILFQAKARRGLPARSVPAEYLTHLLKPGDLESRPGHDRSDG